MNFELNDDQQAYIASAKAFSEKELAPHAAVSDEEQQQQEPYVNVDLSTEEV